MTLTWVFIGMVIGLFAAERKKFNLLAGAAVGALLGPLAVLMFFASGPKMRVCPYCAEKVLPEAKVCKHCRKDLPEVSPPTAASVARGVALLVIAGGLTLACAGEPAAPSGEISSEAAQQLVLEREAVRDEAAAEARRYQAEIAELQGEIAALRAQLGMAEETAEQAAERAARYEAGLGKAVEKLNEVAQEASDAKRVAAATRAASAYQATARTEAEPTADLSYFTDPRLSIVENSIMASGRYYNSGYGQAIGMLYLDLVRNGEVISTAEQRLRVNQRSWGSWQQEFHATPSGAQISVVPRFEPE